MVSFENCAHTWKFLATLLIETFAGEKLKPPIKLDHEVVAAEDELEGF